MKTETRAVVIGGGLVGCSILYHLTKLGWNDAKSTKSLKKKPARGAVFFSRDQFILRKPKTASISSACRRQRPDTLMLNFTSSL